jgi:hypothetical protein
VYVGVLITFPNDYETSSMNLYLHTFLHNLVSILTNKNLGLGIYYVPGPFFLLQHCLVQAHMPATTVFVAPSRNPQKGRGPTTRTHLHPLHHHKPQSLPGSHLIPTALDTQWPVSFFLSLFIHLSVMVTLIQRRECV